jgi:hypothetical protein
MWLRIWSSGGFIDYLRGYKLFKMNCLLIPLRPVQLITPGRHLFTALSGYSHGETEENWKTSQ